MWKTRSIYSWCDNYTLVVFNLRNLQCKFLKAIIILCGWQISKKYDISSKG